MAAKIFYRDRTKVGEGKKAPRFKIVAITGADIKIYAKPLRKQELDQIAEAIGAELILLKATSKKEDDVEVKE